MMTYFSPLQRHDFAVGRSADDRVVPGDGLAVARSAEVLLAVTRCVGEVLPRLPSSAVVNGTLQHKDARSEAS